MPHLGEIDVNRENDDDEDEDVDDDDDDGDGGGGSGDDDECWLSCHLTVDYFLVIWGFPLRFTISTWIFLLEPCLDGLCGILNHRSTELLTPLISITSTGKL